MPPVAQGIARRSRVPSLSGPSRLRLVRTASGLTQVELSQRVGIAVSYLNQIEKGRVLPSTALLRRLARALHVTPQTLFPTHTGGEDGQE